MAAATITGLVSLVFPVPGMFGASLLIPEGLLGVHGTMWLVLSYCLNFALFFGMAYLVLGRVFKANN